MLKLCCNLSDLEFLLPQFSLSCYSGIIQQRTQCNKKFMCSKIFHKVEFINLLDLCFLHIAMTQASLCQKSSEEALQNQTAACYTATRFCRLMGKMFAPHHRTMHRDFYRSRSLTCHKKHNYCFSVYCMTKFLRYLN